MVYEVRVPKVIQNDTKQKTNRFAHGACTPKKRQLVNDMITRAITLAIITTHKSAHYPPDDNNISTTSTTK